MVAGTRATQRIVPCPSAALIFSHSSGSVPILSVMMVGTTRRRAVVLEDETAIRSAVAVIFGRSGFEVATTETAADAVDAAKRMQPDAIVVDVALTGARGLGLLSDLLVVSPHSAIVLLSAFEALRDPALRMGARALIGVTDLRPLEQFLEHMTEPAHVDCDCCPPVTEGAATSPDLDPGSPRTRAEGQSRAPLNRYFGVTGGPSSTASSAGSRRRKPPPS